MKENLFLKPEKDLVSTLQSVFSYYECFVRPKFMKYYKQYKWDVSARRAFIKDWQSNISFWITKKSIKTFYAHIYDNLIKFYVWGASDSKTDREKSDVVERYLLRNYSVSKTKNPLHLQILDSLITGEWYWCPWFKKSKRTVTYIKDWKKYTKSTEKASWVYEYISPFEMLRDPWAKDPETTRYKIRRRLVAKDRINNVYKWRFKLSTEQLKFFEENEDYFSSTDRDYEKNLIMGDLMSFANQKKSVDRANDVYVWNSASATQASINSSYTFDKNKYLECVEQWIDDWEDWVVRIFINQKLVYDWINVRPIKEDPFTCLYFSREWWSIRGDWIAELLKDYEDMGTAFLNAYIDHVKLTSNPIMLKVVWPSQIKTPNNMLELAPWEIIPIDDPNQLQPLNLWNANIQIMDLVQFLENAAFVAAGINEIVMGSPMASSKVPRVASDVVNRVQWFKVRMLNLFDSLWDVMSKIASWRIELWKIYMPEWTIMKIFDEEEKAFIWAKYDADTLQWQYDVVFDAQSLRTAFKEIRIAQLNQFLAVASAYWVDPTTWLANMDFKKILWEVASYLDLPDDFLISQKDALKNIEKWEKWKVKIQKDIQQSMQPQQPAPEGQLPTPEEQPSMPTQQPIKEQWWDILQNALSPIQ